ncbi:cardiolipin synthase [Paenibacillus sp. BIHB 4019]|uniref:Cardiolipin synthase n=1 Tax=Paenibacillus sp. BIHB 4019 TaxID=1870819 RepID=A0A1B2DCC6_9BACL|nr:cardiolipin synthase [Paenibacillus sp. BIHB 4019]ANY65358.1 cardiolipin synthase [Paenibacillus sp. BIHB 4019]
MSVWLIIIALAIVLGLYLLQFVFIFTMEYRRPARLAAWLTITMLLPILGIALYLLLARPVNRQSSHTHKRLAQEKLLQAGKLTHNAQSFADLKASPELDGQKQLFRLLTASKGHCITLCNKVHVLQNGHDTYEAILAAISRAQSYIHLDYYTIRDDGIGQRFKHALIERAKAGVKVRVLYDGIGSMNLSQAYIHELDMAGIQTSCFLPPRHAWYERRLNNRNHSKIAVIDGKIGFVGGINIGDEYLGKNPRLGFWRDTHVQLEGDAVYFLQQLFRSDWAFAAKEELSGALYMPLHHCEGNDPVLITPGGPDQIGEPILESVVASVMAAKESISLSTPYFIPDPGLLMALRVAALSGVDVRIIIPGKGDSQLVLWATLSYVEPLLKAGIKVFRYRKGFIHAKVLIIDRMLASVGTANMDMRSFYNNYEQNALLFDAGSISQLKRDFRQDERDSEELSLNRFSERPVLQKMAEAAAHLLSPLL